jgi:hypothetical protein
MNSYQKELLKKIEALKAQIPTVKGEDKTRLNRQLKKLAHWLTEDDAREHDLKFGRKQDPGGRSRSPAFGKWSNHECS